MKSTETASSEYQESEETKGIKFTGRFKHPATGDAVDEIIADKIIPEKETFDSQIKGTDDQLTPLEKIQKTYYKSEISKNKVKNFFYSFCVFIATVVTAFWIYELTSLAGPTSANTKEIENLKDKNTGFDTRIQALDNRLYDLINKINSTVKK